MLQAMPTTRTPERRARPRRSLVLVLPGGQPVSSERLAERLRGFGDDASNVIVACAGTPGDLGALEAVASNAQFLLAPAETTAEELRELAIQFAPGDLVTLLDAEQAPARSWPDYSSATAR